MVSGVGLPFKKNATTAPGAAEKVQIALAGLDEKTTCFTKGVVSMSTKKY